MKSFVGDEEYSVKKVQTACQQKVDNLQDIKRLAPEAINYPTE